MTLHTKKTTLTTRLLLFATFAAFVFEQSPANEALRALIGFNVLSQTHSPFVVGLVVAVVTVLVELSSSFLMIYSLRSSKKFKRFTAKFTKKHAQNAEKSGNNLFSDYMLALGLGAGTLIIKKHLQKSYLSKGEAFRNAIEASIAIALFSGFVGFLAGGGVEIARQYGLGAQAQFFLDVVTDWRFWLGIVVVSQIAEILLSKFKRQSA